MRSFSLSYDLKPEKTSKVLYLRSVTPRPDSRAIVFLNFDLDLTLRCPLKMQYQLISVLCHFVIFIL